MIDSALKNWTLKVLENFAYRYIQTEFSGEITAHEDRPGEIFSAWALEPDMKEALKIPSHEVVEGFKKQIKLKSKQHRPTLCYGIICEYLEYQGPESPGKVRALALANWDFPEHSTQTDKQRVVEETLEFEELPILRKQLPLVFERLCTLFDT